MKPLMQRTNVNYATDQTIQGNHRHAVQDLNRYREQDSHAKGDELLQFLRSYGASRVSSRLNDERRCVSPHHVLDLGRNGFFGLQLSKSVGGLGLTYKDTFRVLQQLAAVDPNIMLLTSVHYAIGTPPIAHFATDKLKKQILPELASGRALATIASSEPGAGANMKGITTTAIKQMDGSYVLNGEKSWISLGSWAEYITVTAQLFDTDGQHLGLSAFLVRQGAPGFEPGEEAMTFGMKGIPQNRIRIKNLCLPPENLLGQEGQGAEIAQVSFMLGRCIVAVGGIGAMKRCLQIVYRFASQRSIATGNLIDNGLIDSQFKTMIASVQSLEKIVDYIASELDAKKIPASQILIAAKILGSELMWKTIDRCVQLLGARGFMDNNIVGQYFRDMRLMRIFEGPTESLTSYLGLTVIKDPAAFDVLLRSTLEKDAVTDTVGHIVSGILQKFKNLDSSDILQKKKKELILSQLGELASFAILLALNESDFTVQCFEEALYVLKKELAASTLTVRDCNIQSIIKGFKNEIGDIDQTLKEEDHGLDQLLRKKIESV